MRKKRSTYIAGIVYIILALITWSCDEPDDTNVNTDDNIDNVDDSDDGINGDFFSSMATAANNLIEKFEDDNVDLTYFQYDFESEQWRNWTNVSVREFPRSNGIRLGDMSDDQEELAQTLIQTSFSEQGYELVSAIQEANVWTADNWQEQQVAAIGDPMGGYNADNAYLAVFGTPSSSNPAWGYRLNGHHIAVNIVLNGEEVTYTPVFIGADFRSETNPAAVNQELPFSAELIAAAESFYNSLSNAQQETASNGLGDNQNLMLTPANPTPEADERNPQYLEDNTNAFPFHPDEERLPFGFSNEKYEMNFGDGLSLSQLDNSQETALQGIIGFFTGSMIAELAEVEMTSIINNWDNGVYRHITTGSGRMYYSIYIPDVIAIEFWNAEAEKHYHATWSTPGRNYGGLFDGGNSGGRRGSSSIGTSEILRHLAESDHHQKHDHSHDQDHHHGHAHAHHHH